MNSVDYIMISRRFASAPRTVLHEDAGCGDGLVLVFHVFLLSAELVITDDEHSTKDSSIREFFFFLSCFFLGRERRTAS